MGEDGGGGEYGESADRVFEQEQGGAGAQCICAGDAVHAERGDEQGGAGDGAMAGRAQEGGGAGMADVRGGECDGECAAGLLAGGGKWWEYVLSAVYGPLASMPGVGEALEALGTQAIRLAGKAMDNETMSKAKMRASVGRALIDVSGTVRAIGKLYELMTDDEEHELTDYTRAASTIGRVSGTALGWMGNTVGYTAMLLSVMANPADFAARVYRNVKHYVGG